MATITETITNNTSPDAATPEGTVASAATASSSDESTFSVGEDFQGLVDAKGWSSMDDVLKSYRNLEASVGSDENILKLPDEGESFDAVYDKLGRPESPDKYDVEGLDPEADAWYTQKAYELGLNTEQVKGLFEAHREHGAAQAVPSPSLDELRESMGADKYNQTIAQGRKAAEHLSLDTETLTAVEQSLGSEKLLDMLSRMGALLGEGAFKGDAQVASPQGKVEAAKTRWNKLQSDSNFKQQLLNGDKHAIELRAELFQAIYGG